MDVTILSALLRPKLTVYFSMKYWETGDIDPHYTPLFKGPLFRSLLSVENILSRWNDAIPQNMFFVYFLDDFAQNGDDKNGETDQPEFEDLDQPDELEDLDQADGDDDNDLAENGDDELAENEDDEDGGSDQGTVKSRCGNLQK